MDFYQDTNGSVLGIINQIKPMPDFVKSARAKKREEIKDNQFAYSEKRAYPVYDPASAYLSFAYSCVSKEEVPQSVRDNIIKKACFLGVKDDILDFTQRFAHAKKTLMEKSAEDQDYFGLPEKRAYPIRSLEHVFLAEDHFNKNYKEYTIPERIKISRFITKKASEHDYCLNSSVIKKYSEEKIITLEKEAHENIKQRALFCSDQKEKEAYLGISNLVKGKSSDVIGMMKLATVIEKLDKVTGIDKFYSKGVKDPHESIFTTTIKEAQEMVEIIRLGEDNYPVADLEEIPLDVYEEALGSDFASQIQDASGEINKRTLMEILPTLPMDEKVVLKDFIDQEIAAKENTNEY